MKKLILTAVMVLALSFANHAQNNNPAVPNDRPKHERANMKPEERAAKDAAKAQKDLGLNAEQTNKWQVASLERMHANQPLKEKFKGSTTPEERMQLRKQMKSNADKFDSDVSGFLTPEQKTKFEQNKQSRQQMHKGKMRHGSGQPTGEPGSNH